MEVERSLSGNKTMKKLRLSGSGETLPKHFCHHLLLGIRRNSSLSDVHLTLNHRTGIVLMMVGWCMSVTYCVTQLYIV